MKSQTASLMLTLWFLPLATAAQAQSAGPLRVHPENGRYFTDNNGKAILLAGSHTWPNLVDMGPTDPPAEFDFDKHLAWLKSYGHNFTRGWTWEPTRWDTTGMKAWRNGNHHVSPQPWLRTGPGLALDGKPKFDLTQHNPVYLERIRTRLAKARDAGVFMSVMLFEGYGVQFQKDAWPNHPMNPSNNINDIDGDKNGDGKGIEIHQLAKKRVTKIQEAYLRWLVTGLNDFDNLLFEVSNETHPSSTKWQYHIIRFVKELENSLPNQHPVGMTYQNNHGKNEKLWESPADWVSPNRDGGFRDDPPDMQGRKVIVVDTDHLWGIGGDATWVWKSVTRGLNPIFMDTYDGQVLAKVRPEDDGPRRAMGLAIEYSRRFDFAKAIPQGELSSTGYCLAEPGATYLVFAPEGGEFEVDLAPTDQPYRAEWREAASGKLMKAPPVTGGAKRTFRAPFSGAAILFLNSALQSPTR